MAGHEVAQRLPAHTGGDRPLLNWDTIGHERSSEFFDIADEGRRKTTETLSRESTNRGDAYGDEHEVRKAEDEALDQLLCLQLSALCRALAAGIVFIVARAYMRRERGLLGPSVTPDDGSCAAASSSPWGCHAFDAALAGALSLLLLAGLRVQRMPPRGCDLGDDAAAAYVPQSLRPPSDISLHSHRLIFAAKVLNVAFSVALLRARSRDPACAAARGGPLACAIEEHSSTVALLSVALLAAIRPVPRRLVFLEITRQALCAAIMLPLALSPASGGPAARLAAAARALASSFASAFATMLVASIYSDPELDRLTMRSVCMELSLGPRPLRPALSRFLALVTRVRGELLLPRVVRTADGQDQTYPPPKQPPPPRAAAAGECGLPPSHPPAARRLWSTTESRVSASRRACSTPCTTRTAPPPPSAATSAVRGGVALRRSLSQHGSPNPRGPPVGLTRVCVVDPVSRPPPARSRRVLRHRAGRLAEARRRPGEARHVGAPLRSTRARVLAPQKQQGRPAASPRPPVNAAPHLSA